MHPDKKKMFDFRFLLAAIIFVVTDGIYLNLVKDYFSQQIQQVQGSPISLNIVGLVLCYVFLVSGLYYFIIKPKRTVLDAFLLGIVIYGVYETTNYALLKKWSALTVLMDTLWGGTLFAITTSLMKLV